MITAATLYRLRWGLALLAGLVAAASLALGSLAFAQSAPAKASAKPAPAKIVNKSAPHGQRDCPFKDAPTSVDV